MTNIHEEYAALLKRFKGGDDSAFGEIYEKSSRLVYTTCYGVLQNKEDAEDAAQETYISLYNHIDTIKEDMTLVSWLSRTAYNKASDIKAKKKPGVAYEEAVASEEILEYDADLETLPETLITTKTNRDIIKKIIRDKLSDDQYETVLLYYYNELPLSAIADVMHCPEGTIKSRLKVSRAKIKSGIESYEKLHGDKLAGAAATPFLTRFFGECSNELTIPAINPFPANIAANTAAASGASEGAEAAKTAETVKAAKTAGAAKTGAKASFLSSPLTKAGIAVVAVAALAVPTVFAVKNIKETLDTKPARISSGMAYARSGEGGETEETDTTSDTEPSETAGDDGAVVTESSEPISDDPVPAAVMAEIPLDEVAEFDQLQMFVERWRALKYDCEHPGGSSWNGFVYTVMNGKGRPLINYAYYFKDSNYDYDLGAEILDEDLMGYYTDGYINGRIEEEHLYWIEENILNISTADMVSINSEVSKVSDWTVSPEYIYEGYLYHNWDENTNANDLKHEIIKAQYDGTYYYFTDHMQNYRDGELLSECDIYYKMQLKYIDGYYYWSLISCSDVN